MIIISGGPNWEWRHAATIATQAIPVVIGA